MVGFECAGDDDAGAVAVEARAGVGVAGLAGIGVAVVDSGKFGVVANWRICQATELNILITDTGATDEMIAPFQKLGIEVVRV